MKWKETIYWIRQTKWYRNDFCVCVCRIYFQHCSCWNWIFNIMILSFFFFSLSPCVGLGAHYALHSKSDHSYVNASSYNQYKYFDRWNDLTRWIDIFVLLSIVLILSHSSLFLTVSVCVCFSLFSFLISLNPLIINAALLRLLLAFVFFFISSHSYSLAYLGIKSDPWRCKWKKKT